MKIATRRSKLAQVQTETVMGMIKDKFNIDCEKLLIETIGDKILDVTLDKIGGKGLFVKEIEMALYDKNADIAVHSMKDVPFELPSGFEIVAIPKREDVRDVFVSMNGCKFNDLRQGAKIGTSSNRRAAQLKMLRPDLEIVPVRGNVQTRIAKIETENLDGIILAAAGLKRLGMESIITNYFDPEEFVPAVGQGALGIETLSDYDNKDMLLHMEDEDTRICVEAERSFMRALGGDCHSTIGAYARIDGDSMKMVGLFEVNGETVKKDIEGKKEDYIKLGKELATKIIG